VVGLCSIDFRVKRYVGHKVAEEPQLLLLVLPLRGQQRSFEQLFGSRAVIRQIFKETILSRLFASVQPLLVLLSETENSSTNPRLFAFSKCPIREVKSHVFQHNPGHSTIRATGSCSHRTTKEMPDACTGSCTNDIRSGCEKLT
jgi:hypothetical protein